MFAYGRLRAVNAILAYDHGGPCRTDDGEVWLDLMLPYAVEVANLRPEATFEGAFRRLRYWMPTTFTEIGRQGFADRWDDLTGLRSMAKGRHRSESDVGHIDWLPTAERIRTETRLTRAKHRSINDLYPDRPPIRGIGVIDPPTEDELREIKRLQAEARRRSQGVVAQSERTKTADAAALASAVGCNERTIRRHMKNGTLPSFLSSKSCDVQNVSPPYNVNRKLHFLDTGFDVEPPPLNPHAESMAILREILSDPFAVEVDADDFVSAVL